MSIIIAIQCGTGGKDDNGELFLKLGHQDNSNELIVPGDNWICRIVGRNDPGTCSTVQQVESRLQKALMSGVTIEQALKDAIVFAASIDFTVCEAYDYLVIER